MKEPKMFVGLDPGKTGYMVIIVGDEIIKLPFPMIGSEYDVHAMVEMFMILDPKNTHVAIEDVKALQSPMQSGNWSLSRGKTILEVACVALNIPFTMVHSKTWQKELWQGVPVQKRKVKGRMKNFPKETTLMAIKRLFPNEDLREEVEVKYYADNANNRKLKRAGLEVPRKGELPHDGLVDALAIAEYCRRKFK